MASLGYDSSSETADDIIREVDYKLKGAIEFQDFLAIAAGLKELQLESAFTHLAQLDQSRLEDGAPGMVDAGGGGDPAGGHAGEKSGQRDSRRMIPVERSGGGT